MTRSFAEVRRLFPCARIARGTTETRRAPRVRRRPSRACPARCRPRAHQPTGRGAVSAHGGDPGLRRLWRAPVLRHERVHALCLPAPSVALRSAPDGELLPTPLLPNRAALLV